MERTGLFALARGGLTLVREDPKLYVFGLVVGGLIAFSAAFVKQAMSDIISDSLDAEILAAVGDGLIVLPVFGPLTLVANAALVTYAVRVAQGHPSVGDAVDRVRRRVWGVVLYGPFMVSILFMVSLPPLMLLAVVDPTGVLVVLLMVGLLVGGVVFLVGSWAVVPSFTISDVRFRHVFRVVWNGVRNGGPRFVGILTVFGVMSWTITGVAESVFGDVLPFGASTLVQIPILGFVSAWYAGTAGYLWIDEASNVAVELENTEGEEVTELTIVCSDLAT